MLRGRRVVLVEDDDIMGTSLLQRLELEGAQVIWCKKMGRALGAIRTPSQPIDAVICDIGLPDGSGEELFETLNRTGSPPPFLFITGQGGIGQAVRLIKSGAADYVTKPFEISVLLERLSLLMAPEEQQHFPTLLGVSPAARHIEELIAHAAAEDRCVFIRGGPGTGKDLIARRIHDLSDRRAAPFISINLAREANVREAMFGQSGALARVGEGTVFINALDRLRKGAQSEFLQILSQGISLRIISACATNLTQQVARGEFDPELFLRLAEREIPVPPLSGRPDDVVWLLKQLFRKLAPIHGSGIEGISAFCEEAARGHSWPGGGREVRARLLRALPMATGSLLQAADLFPEGQLETDEIKPLAEVREAAEKAQIIAALERTEGQVGEAAKKLRIARTTLWEKMQRYDLS